MNHKKLNIPKFKNEDEERNFWEHFELTEHFESNDFKKVSFPELKPSHQAVSLKLPQFMVIRLKEKANEFNISYQTLIKQFIADGLSIRGK